ncbi:MAG TPA: hypothetical protein VGM24_06860 [Puia sp.]|jgi:hypothetical protein
MSGIFKIISGLIANVLDFAFAGYGLVCDNSFIKINLNHLNFRYTRCRDLWVKCYTTPYLREWYSRVAGKLAELINLEENEKWYLRGR